MNKKIKISLCIFVLAFIIPIFTWIGKVDAVGFSQQAWSTEGSTVLFRTPTAAHSSTVGDWKNSCLDTNPTFGCTYRYKLENGIQWAYRNNTANDKYLNNDIPSSAMFTTVGLYFHNTKIGGYNKTTNASAQFGYANYTTNITKDSLLTLATTFAASTRQPMNFPSNVTPSIDYSTYSDTLYRMTIRMISEESGIYISDRQLNSTIVNAIRPHLTTIEERPNSIYVSNIMQSHDSSDRSGPIETFTTPYRFATFISAKWNWGENSRGVSNDGIGAVFNLYDNILTLPSFSKQNIYVRHINIGVANSFSKEEVSRAETNGNWYEGPGYSDAGSGWTLPEDSTYYRYTLNYGDSVKVYYRNPASYVFKQHNGSELAKNSYKYLGYNISTSTTNKTAYDTITDASTISNTTNTSIEITNDNADNDRYTYINMYYATPMTMFLVRHINLDTALTPSATTVNVNKRYVGDPYKDASGNLINGWQTNPDDTFFRTYLSVARPSLTATRVNPATTAFKQANGTTVEIGKYKYLGYRTTSTKDLNTFNSYINNTYPTTLNTGTSFTANNIDLGYNYTFIDMYYRLKNKNHIYVRHINMDVSPSITSASVLAASTAQRIYSGGTTYTTANGWTKGTTHFIKTLTSEPESITISRVNPASDVFLQDDDTSLGTNNYRYLGYNISTGSNLSTVYNAVTSTPSASPNTATSVTVNNLIEGENYTVIDMYYAVSRNNLYVRHVNLDLDTTITTTTVDNAINENRYFKDNVNNSFYKTTNGWILNNTYYNKILRGVSQTISISDLNSITEYSRTFQQDATPTTINELYYRYIGYKIGRGSTLALCNSNFNSASYVSTTGPTSITFTNPESGETFSKLDMYYTRYGKKVYEKHIALNYKRNTIDKRYTEYDTIYTIRLGEQLAALSAKTPDSGYTYIGYINMGESTLEPTNFDTLKPGSFSAKIPWKTLATDEHVYFVYAPIDEGNKTENQPSINIGGKLEFKGAISCNSTSGPIQSAMSGTNITFGITGLPRYVIGGIKTANTNQNNNLTITLVRNVTMNYTRIDGTTSASETVQKRYDFVIPYGYRKYIIDKLLVYGKTESLVYNSGYTGTNSLGLEAQGKRLFANNTYTVSSTIDNILARELVTIGDEYVTSNNVTISGFSVRYAGSTVGKTVTWDGSKYVMNETINAQILTKVYRDNTLKNLNYAYVGGFKYNGIDFISRIYSDTTSEYDYDNIITKAIGTLLTNTDVLPRVNANISNSAKLKVASNGTNTTIAAMEESLNYYNKPLRVVTTSGTTYTTDPVIPIETGFVINNTGKTYYTSGFDIDNSYFKPVATDITTVNGIRSLTGRATYSKSITSTIAFRDNIYFSQNNKIEEKGEIHDSIITPLTTITKEYKKSLGNVDSINIYTPIEISQSVSQGNGKFKVTMNVGPYNGKYGVKDLSNYCKGYYIAFKNFDIQNVIINGTLYRKGEIIDNTTDTTNRNWIWVPYKLDADIEVEIMGANNGDTIKYEVRAVAKNATSTITALINKMSFANFRTAYANICNDKVSPITTMDVPVYYDLYDEQIVTYTAEVSKAYNLRVTDVKDVNFKNVFRITTVTNVGAHNRTAYYSGNKKWIEGTTRYQNRTSSEIGTNPMKTLPVGPYKNTNTAYTKAPKIGYRFSFDLRLSNTFAEQRDVVITPTFYYVSKDGQTFLDNTQIVLLYKNSAGKYVKLGSSGDTYKITFKPNDGYRLIDVHDDDDKPNLSKVTQSLGLITQIRLKGSTMSTKFADDYQTYYGEYKLPNSTIAVKVVSGKYNISNPLKNGYIGVVFSVRSENAAGVYTTIPTLEYKTSPSDWLNEGFLNKKTGTDVKINLEGGKWTINDSIYQKIQGTVILYDIDSRASNDFN